MTQVPTFNRSLLHPRYWITWLGLGLLYALVLLPYPVIYRIGTGLGRFSMRFLKHRYKIARRNIELCFPDMHPEQREDMVVKNFESVGMGLFETGMAWFWPDWRIERWFKVSGLEHIQHARDNKQGVLLIGVHFLTLELGARIFGIHNPGVGVYRPHDNKLMDWIQTLAREGMTMVCVTHEMGFAREVANRVLFFDHGKLLEDSAPEDFFTSPKDLRAQAFLRQVL